MKQPSTREQFGGSFCKNALNKCVACTHVYMTSYLCLHVLKTVPTLSGGTTLDMLIRCVHVFVKQNFSI